MVKVAFVVCRYGLEVTDGPELLCRQVAERMTKHWDVEILTTCAVDSLKLGDEYPPGQTVVNGVPVRRFLVDAFRSVQPFSGPPEALLEEMERVQGEGPCSSGLLNYVSENASSYDFFLFFAYRCATTFFALPLVKGKAGLVPTADDAPPLYLDTYRDFFKFPRVLVFNTSWEQQLVNRWFGTERILQDVAGVGIEVPLDLDPDGFRERHGELLEGRDFLTYVGRIDESNGCRELISHFVRFREDCYGRPVKLVLIGTPVMEIPDHPDIVSLGSVADQEKFEALAAATVIILPSPSEPLSIVALEAWALGKPLLANGRSGMLRDQCIRSNGGLWYDEYLEFRGALELLLDKSSLRRDLGAAGHRFVQAAYTWPIVEAKYQRLLDRVLSGNADVSDGAGRGGIGTWA